MACADVSRLRIICRVCGNRHWPVIDGDQFHFESQFPGGGNQAAAGSSCTTEKICTIESQWEFSRFISGDQGKAIRRRTIDVVRSRFSGDATCNPWGGLLYFNSRSICGASAYRSAPSVQVTWWGIWTVKRALKVW
jgi:hypothetical protein